MGTINGNRKPQERRLKGVVRSAQRMFALAVLWLVAGAYFSPIEAKYAAVVVNATDGTVHHAVNADTRNFPASLTKMMTLYLLFDAVDKGTYTMETRIPITARAARQPASRLGLKAGNSISVEQAIRALVIKSANDVASAVSEALGGSERKFALLMTAEARKIGMTRTTFRNASGLPHRGQMSTARDMTVLARTLLTKFPHHYHYFSERSFKYGGRTYRTHNNVLKQYTGADGFKTGYIRASGFNLVSSATRNGHRLIGVIFGGNTPKGRDRHMMKLLDRAFSTYKRPGTSNLVASRVAPPPRRTVTPRRAKPSPRRIRSSEKQTPDIWGIQVGAFYSRAPARDAAQSTTRRLSKLLSDGEIAIMPLRKSRNRVLYRARIVGIEKRDAYRACRLLKAKRKHCLELRLPGVETASSPRS